MFMRITLRRCTVRNKIVQSSKGMNGKYGRALLLYTMFEQSILFVSLPLL